MTEDEIIQFAEGLPGVDVLTASEATGAPEIAWGDSFFYFDPDRDIPGDRRFPFATIVTKDYPGFDEASNVDREGVFRLNASVGRDSRSCSAIRQGNLPTTSLTSTTPRSTR